MNRPFLKDQIPWEQHTFTTRWFANAYHFSEKLCAILEEERVDFVRVSCDHVFYRVDENGKRKTIPPAKQWIVRIQINDSNSDALLAALKKSGWEDFRTDPETSVLPAKNYWSCDFEFFKFYGSMQLTKQQQDQMVKKLCGELLAKKKNERLSTKKRHAK